MVQTDTEEDTIMIWNLWESKGYGARRLIREFSDQELEMKRNKKLPRKVHKSGLLDLTGSGRPHTSCSCVVQPGALMVQLTNGQHTCQLVFKPKADILNITLWLSVCFLCTWWTLRFTPCLMNQVFFLKVHYTSRKCDVLFSQGSVRTVFRWGGHFFHTWVKHFFLLSLIHIWRCRRSTLCRSRWSPYH